MKLDHNQQAFFALVRGGLWEKEVRLKPFWIVGYREIYRLAQEQSLIGLIAAGLEHVVDEKIPQNTALTIVGNTVQLEKRNLAMNAFIAKLVAKMRDAGIETLLVKGQGIAQCYERPLWRACGDIDLFLDEENYRKASSFLHPFASNAEKENFNIRHLAMTIDSWIVELHGTLYTQIRKRVDQGLQKIQEDTFKNRHVRIWKNGETDVLLPSTDNDVVFVFAHIYQHFFGEGIGLRQICDWCRLLWTYRDTIDRNLLEKRLNEMCLMNKWRAFAALSVNYLGMPEEAMPFYSPEKKWKRKADAIISLILRSGNFGHAVDKSYKQQYPLVIGLAMSSFYHTYIAFLHFLIFPRDSFLGWLRLMRDGIKAYVKRRERKVRKKRKK